MRSCPFCLLVLGVGGNDTVSSTDEASFLGTKELPILRTGFKGEEIISMSERLELDAELRVITGKKVKQLRRAGQIPAVLYGPGMEGINLAIAEPDLRHTLAQAAGTQLIELHVGDQNYTALARAVQRDAIRGDLIHVDFYRVVLDRVIRAEVPVVLVGESPLVASRQGVINQVLTSVEIEALPTDLIPQIEVDMTPLVEVGDSILVGDLDLPDTITLQAGPSEVVVKIDHLAAEEIMEEEEMVVAELSPEEVPVIGHGKEDAAE